MKAEIRVESSFLFLMTLLYYLDQEGTFPWLVLFCTLHELGHWGAIRFLGGGVDRLVLSCAGAEMRLSPVCPLGPGALALAALAGPAVNLLLALTLSRLAVRGAGERLYLLAGVNLALGLFNLLPVRWLDGGRALAAVLELEGSEGERTVTWATRITGGVILILGVWLFWSGRGRNFSLLLVGLWMLAMSAREGVGQLGKK